MLSKWHCRYRWAVNRTANFDRKLCLKSVLIIIFSSLRLFFSQSIFLLSWPLRWSTLTGQNYHVQPPLTYNWTDFDTFPWTELRTKIFHMLWDVFMNIGMGFQINELSFVTLTCSIRQLPSLDGWNLGLAEGVHGHRPRPWREARGWFACIAWVYLPLVLELADTFPPLGLLWRCLFGTCSAPELDKSPPNTSASPQGQARSHDLRTRHGHNLNLNLFVFS